MKNLTDQELVDRLQARLREADELMQEYCAGSPDALKFGWDWPTFAVLFPEQYTQIKSLKQECHRRVAERSKK